MRSLYFQGKQFNSLIIDLDPDLYPAALLINPDIQNQELTILWIINNLFLRFNSRGILIYLLQCFPSWFKTKYSNAACLPLIVILISQYDRGTISKICSNTFNFKFLKKFFFKLRSSSTPQYKINLDRENYYSVLVFLTFLLPVYPRHGFKKML